MHGKAGNFLSEWMIFAFCAVVLAFLLGYDIRHEHAFIAERETQRLTSVAKVAEYMLAAAVGRATPVLLDVLSRYPRAPAGRTRRLWRGHRKRRQASGAQRWFPAYHR